MNNLDKQYQELLKEILNTGFDKSDRTGTGTISIFGTHLKHQMKEGFPILTTKKVYWKGIVHELLWFLKGDTNIKYLVDNNVNIWNGDAYKNYCKKIQDSFKPGNEVVLKSFAANGFLSGNGKPYEMEKFVEKVKYDKYFATLFGELGHVYGNQWRKCKNYNSQKRVATYDQLNDVIKTLKNNPDDRGMIVNAWNVGEIDEMVLRPCHYSFQFWTRELSLEERNNYYMRFYKGLPYNEHKNLDELNIPKRAISLSWNQRSVDTFLGLPFNIASYGLLLSMVAKVVNMIPETITFNGGDTHIYKNHLSQCIEQLTKDGYNLPSLKFKNEEYNSIDDFTFDDIILENYKSEETIKAPLSN